MSCSGAHETFRALLASADFDPQMLVTIIVQAKEVGSGKGFQGLKRIIIELITQASCSDVLVEAIDSFLESPSSTEISAIQKVLHCAANERFQSQLFAFESLTLNRFFC